MPDLMDLLLIGETSTSMSSESFMFSEDLELYTAFEIQNLFRRSPTLQSPLTGVAIHIDVRVAVMVVILDVVVYSLELIERVLLEVLVAVDRVLLVVVAVEVLIGLIQRRLLVELGRLDHRRLCGLRVGLKIQFLGVLIGDCRSGTRVVKLTSRSEPLTISTNCRHFSMNSRF